MSTIQRTLAIIKPDAVGRGLAPEILARIHKAGFQIAALKTMRLTKSEAEGFYAVHKARPFFNDLTTFMSSGKVVAMVLEAPGAIAKWRETVRDWYAGERTGARRGRNVWPPDNWGWSSGKPAR